MGETTDLLPAYPLPASPAPAGSGPGLCDHNMLAPWQAVLTGPPGASTQLKPAPTPRCASCQATAGMEQLRWGRPSGSCPPPCLKPRPSSLGRNFPPKRFHFWASQRRPTLFCPGGWSPPTRNHLARGCKAFDVVPCPLLECSSVFLPSHQNPSQVLLCP